MDIRNIKELDELFKMAYGSFGTDYDKNKMKEPVAKYLQDNLFKNKRESENFSIDDAKKTLSTEKYELNVRQAKDKLRVATANIDFINDITAKVVEQALSGNVRSFMQAEEAALYHLEKYVTKYGQNASAIHTNEYDELRDRGVNIHLVDELVSGLEKQILAQSREQLREQIQAQSHIQSSSKSWDTIHKDRPIGSQALADEKQKGTELQNQQQGAATHKHN